MGILPVSIQQRISDPPFYFRKVAEQQKVQRLVDGLQQGLNAAYRRWGELKALRARP